MDDLEAYVRDLMPDIETMTPDAQRAFLEGLAPNVKQDLLERVAKAFVASESDKLVDLIRKGRV